MRGWRRVNDPADFSYWPPFKFIGKLNKLTVELKPEATSEICVKYGPRSHVGRASVDPSIPDDGCQAQRCARAPALGERQMRGTQVTCREAARSRRAGEAALSGQSLTGERRSLRKIAAAQHDGVRLIYRTTDRDGAPLDVSELVRSAAAGSGSAA